MYFAFGYGLYFYFTWLPTYLIKVLGFSLLGGGIFAALPFLLAGIADLVGGWLTDHLSKRYGLRVGRCHLGLCRVPHLRAAGVFVHAADPGHREGAAARAGARVRRPRARRVLGGAARHRARSRRGRHRLHEHARQSRRPASVRSSSASPWTAGTRGRFRSTSRRWSTRAARSRGWRSIRRRQSGRPRTGSQRSTIEQSRRQLPEVRPRRNVKGRCRRASP